MNRILGIATIAATLFGCAGTLGGKTRDSLREGVTGKQADLQACYAEALQRNRDAAGQVEVALHVQHDTKNVHQVDVGESAIQDQEMQACVQRALVGVTVAEAPSQNVRAHFLIDFQPNGEAPAVVEGAPGADAAGGTVPAGDPAAETAGAQE